MSVAVTFTTTPVASAGTWPAPAMGTTRVPLAGTAPAATPRPERVSTTRWGVAAANRPSVASGLLDMPAAGSVIGVATAGAAAGAAEPFTTSKVTHSCEPLATTPTPTRS